MSTSEERKSQPLRRIHRTLRLTPEAELSGQSKIARAALIAFPALAGIGASCLLVVKLYTFVEYVIAYSVMYGSMCLCSFVAVWVGNRRQRRTALLLLII